MKTLQNGLVPLTQNELVEIDGGSVLGTIIAAIVIASCSEIISDWDNFKAGLFGKAEYKG
ncbi:MAG: hypothetical protein ISS19_05075 [Bacteroidales bacterium]|nr:hypothetical protein [Bacteroidales bacterium]